MMDLSSQSLTLQPSEWPLRRPRTTPGIGPDPFGSTRNLPQRVSEAGRQGVVVAEGTAPRNATSGPQGLQRSLFAVRLLQASGARSASLPSVPPRRFTAGGADCVYVLKPVRSDA